ncbi:MAG TPA: hypothetical protein IGR64_04000 [Leptolyngbyaceae cyanobacterium M65_K2018_010]|nr:hypothetical protein [Leptolyngbyaceae cyanobacterium M65_K2018_010]
MATPSLLQQAQNGDETAIAAWLSQFLQPQGIALRVERHSYCLHLKLAAKTLPPQTALVAYLHRAVERLQIASLGILQIQAESTTIPGDSWQVELSLLGSEWRDRHPLESQPQALAEVSSTTSNPLDADLASQLQALLRRRGLPAQVSLQGTELHIRWPMVRVTNPQQATAQIHRLLHQPGQPGLGTVQAIVYSGLDRRNQVVWQQCRPRVRPAFPAGQPNGLRWRADHRESLVFAMLLALGLIMNAIPLVNGLLQGIKICFHELGHATVAWLAGRQALPLPIGWTILNPQRSLLVYLGLLTLLGLLYWTGRRQRQRWLLGLAIGLGVLQFGMTWLLSPDTFAMLFAFGGVGGELYLSTLLMVSFFFPLPPAWRWEVYRYPVGLAAAFTFWGQFWLWQRIRAGQASIPFGSLWGEPSQGDMNLLVDLHGWTPGAIITTYHGLANLCLVVLLGVYGYQGLKPYRPWLLALGQRWMARL